MSLQAGTRLNDRYEVVRAISSGGMGSLFEGRDLQSQNCRVAIKQMLEHLMEGDQAKLFRSKFEAEIEFLRQLSHPGIPKLYDSFIAEGKYYIVMEFVVGRNLEQELEERLQLTGQPMAVEQLLNDTRQVLQILDYLHSLNPPLLHRDIKPANLIREHPSGRIKLVDFGMARLLSEPNKTQTQLGTLGYSPLEQLQGKADQRSDLYALGATLHHLITGVAPTVLNIPPVSKLRPDLDPNLAALIDRACSSEISIRFYSALEMLRNLDQIQPSSPPPTTDSGSLLQPLPLQHEEVPVAPPAPIEPTPEVPDLPPLVLPTRPAFVQQPLPQMTRRPIRQKGWTPGQWAGGILLLSALAFGMGWGLGHRPKPKESATPGVGLSASATPEVAKSATPQATSLPVVAPPSATPLASASPVEATATAAPEEVVTPSLPGPSGPSYPTAKNTTPAEPESLALMNSSSHLEVALPAGWKAVARVLTQETFFRAYRFEAAQYELNLDLKGYQLSGSQETYRNSFATKHSGWNELRLAGADLAFSRKSSRSPHLEALILRADHYYFISLRGNGSAMNRDLFSRQVEEVWPCLQVVD